MEFPSTIPPRLFVHRDGLIPFAIGQGFAPPSFGFAPDHTDAANLLELEAVAGVEEAMPLPFAD